MNNQNIDIIQGQKIELTQLNLSVDGYEAKVSLEFLLNDELFCIHFHNVSNLTVKNFSMPFQISGFEILDNKYRGWERALRYTVHDFEEGILKFFCEYFELEHN